MVPMLSLEMSIIDIFLVVAIIIIPLLLYVRKTVLTMDKKHTIKVFLGLLGISLVLFIPFFSLVSTSPFLAGIGMWIVFIAMLFQKDRIQKAMKYGREAELSREKRKPLEELGSNIITSKISKEREFFSRLLEDCPQHFGYLETLPLGSSVPEACYNCSRIKQCLFSNERQVEIAQA